MSAITLSPYDSRDIRYSSAVTGLPPTASLREFAAVVDDQGWSNACTGHATTSAMELLLARAGTPVQLSRMWAYWHGRTEEQRRVDAGAHLRGVLKALAKVGVVTETQYPFDHKKLTTPPPALTPAHFVLRYLSVGTKTDYDVAQVKSAIATGKPVVIGMDLSPQPWGRHGVMHAMVLTGYDPQGFTVWNSWGAHWGDGGFAALSEDDFKRYVFEAWVLDEVKGAEVPPLWNAPTTKTRVFLDSHETFTAAGRGYAVHGGSMGSVLRLTPGCRDIQFDQNVVTLEMPYTSTVTMAFLQQGNNVHVYDGALRVAYGPIRRDGLAIVTDNGQQPNKVAWQGAAMVFNDTINIGSDGPTKTWI